MKKAPDPGLFLLLALAELAVCFAWRRALVLVLACGHFAFPPWIVSITVKRRSTLNPHLKIPVPIASTPVVDASCIISTKVIW